MVLSGVVVLAVVGTWVISLIGYLVGTFVEADTGFQGSYNDCVTVSSVVAIGRLDLVVLGLVALGMYR